MNQKYSAPLIKLEEDSATKADTGKNRLELWPVTPYEEIGLVLTWGAEKYADHNWRKGFVWSRVYGAALRHLYAWWKGEEKDPESGFSHLAHAACNIIFLLEFTHTKRQLDDRYRSDNQTNSTASTN